jgi:hypothetical protein
MIRLNRKLWILRIFTSARGVPAGIKPAARELKTLACPHFNMSGSTYSFKNSGWRAP